MQPYPNTPHNAEDYASSRAMFERITTHMSDPRTSGNTAEEFEEFLDARGDDLKRQLLQDRLDALAAVETRLPEVIGSDDVPRCPFPVEVPRSNVADQRGADLVEQRRCSSSRCICPEIVSVAGIPIQSVPKWRGVVSVTVGAAERGFARCGR